MVPEKDIETIESIFEQKSKAETWWKGLYSDLNTVLTDICANTSYMGADEFVTCQALYNSTLYSLDGLKVADGQQMSQNPYGDLWHKFYTIIRDCNTFLENIDNTYNMDEDERNWWKSDVKVLKAYIYFRVDAPLWPDLSGSRKYAGGPGCERVSTAAPTCRYLF